jgi:hypothetical protein
MIDLDAESQRHLIEFYRAELTQIANGEKLDPTIFKILSRKGLIAYNHVGRGYQYTVSPEALQILGIKETIL